MDAGNLSATAVPHLSPTALSVWELAFIAYGNMSYAKSHMYTALVKMGTHSSEVAYMETGADWMKPQCPIWSLDSQTLLMTGPGSSSVLRPQTHRATGHPDPSLFASPEYRSEQA